jgi:hypothetical protein
MNMLDVDEAENEIPNTIKSKPLSPHVVEMVGAQSYAATFIGKRSDHLLIRLVKVALIPEYIPEIQNEVINGDLIQEY